MAQPLIKSFDNLATEYGEEYTGDTVVQGLQRELNKAMSTNGFIAGQTTTEDATVLRLQNLDATLTSVLFTNRHLKLFNAFPRVPSIQEFFEYNVRLSYGGGRSAAGFSQGGGPKGGAASWERKNGTIRWLGVQGGVTHQMLTTGMLGGTQLNPVEEENKNRTYELMEKLERNVIWGLQSINSEDGQTVNYDGFMQQMGALSVGAGTTAPANVMDMQGAAVSFDTLEEVSEKLYNTAYIGSLDEYLCFLSPGVLSDLSKIRLGTGTNPGANSAQRHMLDGNAAPVRDGIPQSGFQSNYGFIGYEPSIFLSERVRSNRPFLAANELPNLQSADSGAPTANAAPTLAVAVDASSKLPGAVVYYYVVASFNDSGESLGVVSAASITSVAGDNNTVTIPRNTDTTCTGYRIYRTNGAGGANDANGVNARWIADVPQTVSGSATYLDRNQIVPGSGLMILVRPNVEDIVIPQMSPLIKWPLAITSTTINFYLLLYHTMIVKATQRHFVIKNIGRLVAGT